MSDSRVQWTIGLVFGAKTSQYELFINPSMGLAADSYPPTTAPDQSIYTSLDNSITWLENHRPKDEIELSANFTDNFLALLNHDVQKFLVDEEERFELVSRKLDELLKLAEERKDLGLPVELAEEVKMADEKPSLATRKKHLETLVTDRKKIGDRMELRAKKPLKDLLEELHQEAKLLGEKDLREKIYTSRIFLNADAYKLPERLQNFKEEQEGYSYAAYILLAIVGVTALIGAAAAVFTLWPLLALPTMTLSKVIVVGALSGFASAACMASIYLIGEELYNCFFPRPLSRTLHPLTAAFLKKPCKNEQRSSTSCCLTWFSHSNSNNNDRRDSGPTRRNSGPTLIGDGLSTPSIGPMTVHHTKASPPLLRLPSPPKASVVIPAVVKVGSFAPRTPQGLSAVPPQKVSTVRRGSWPNC